MTSLVMGMFVAVTVAMRCCRSRPRGGTCRSMRRLIAPRNARRNGYVF